MKSLFFRNKNWCIILFFVGFPFGLSLSLWLGYSCWLTVCVVKVTFLSNSWWWVGRFGFGRNETATVHYNTQSQLGICPFHVWVVTYSCYMYKSTEHNKTSRVESIVVVYYTSQVGCDSVWGLFNKAYTVTTLCVHFVKVSHFSWRFWFSFCGAEYI